ncbi:hypothetical protein Tcan_00623, partial [Toxocara canis]
LAECKAIINERLLTFISDDSVNILCLAVEGSQTMTNGIDEEYRPKMTNSQGQLVKKWKSSKALIVFGDSGRKPTWIHYEKMIKWNIGIHDPQRGGHLRRMKSCLSKKRVLQE